MMDKAIEQNQQPEQQTHVVQVQDLEALIALVEERVIENLAQIIERMVQAQGETKFRTGNGSGSSGS